MTLLPSARPDLSIAGIHQFVITQYFETLNAGEFDQTATLFAPDGMLQPPFEPPVVGHEAIAAYLYREAAGIVLQHRGMRGL